MYYPTVGMIHNFLEWGGFGCILSVYKINKYPLGLIMANANRIGKEINGITHCIFLLGDTEGLLSAPPNDPTAELIEEWNSRRSISGEHDSQQDVTGGIFLKLDSAAKIATVVPNVWFICGRRSERVLELVNSGNTRGTRILP